MHIGNHGTQRRHAAPRWREGGARHRLDQRHRPRHRPARSPQRRGSCSTASASRRDREACGTLIARDFGVEISIDGADMSKPDAIRAMVDTLDRTSARSTSSSTMPASSMSRRSRVPAAKMGRDPRDQSVRRLPRHRAGLPGMKQRNGAASSMSPRRTGSSPRRSRPPMSPPSTAWSA